MAEPGSLTDPEPWQEVADTNTASVWLPLCISCNISSIPSQLGLSQEALILFALGILGVRVGLSHTPKSTWYTRVSLRYELSMLKVDGLRKA